MILADYLSRHRHKDLDPSELIPISFCCLRTYRSLIDDRIGEEIFSVKTRAGAKAIGESVGEVHGADKPLDPNYKPEHQSKSKLPSVVGNKSPIKSVRKPPPQTPARSTPRRVITLKSVRIQTSSTNDMPDTIQNPTPQQTPMVHGGARPKTRIVGTPMALPSQSHIQPLIPRRILSSTSLGEQGEDVDKASRAIPRIIRDIEEKRRKFEEKKDQLIRDLDEERRRIVEEQNKKIFHPPPIKGIDLEEGLETLDPEIRIPTEEDFVLPPPLESLLDKAKMAYKFLPKQGDIDRLIAKINKKVLRDTNLCVDLRDLKAAYLTSPHFRDIYLHLLQNRMPLGKGAAGRLDQNYLISDGLLFKTLDDGERKLDTVLCIPTAKVHILLNAYHSRMIGGHTGITKCYHTISQRFYCPNLAENLRAYITGCHVCQLFKKGKEFKRPYQKRINLNVPAMTKISMDIKQMPVNKGYSHILVLLCEVTNYMVALPLMSTRTPHIVRHNLTMHRSATPFIIRQPIQRPHLLERVYKPMHTSH